MKNENIYYKFYNYRNYKYLLLWIFIKIILMDKREGFFWLWVFMVRVCKLLKICFGVVWVW